MITILLKLNIPGAGSNDNNINEYNKTDLKWNGDFRSNECIQILNECDIIYIII